MDRINYISRKFYLTFVLLFLVFFGQGCQKDLAFYEYVELIDFYPYITHGFETLKLKFNRKDRQWSNYQLLGFQTYEDQLPRIWAAKKETTIVVFFSEVDDKEVRFRCRPYNVPGSPPQEGQIFVNNHFIKKIIFNKKGHYKFQIKKDFLEYGSNRITFKWKYLKSPFDYGLNKDKRKFALGFSQLEFHSSSKGIKERIHTYKVMLDQKGNSSGILMPQGSIIEYYLNLLEKPISSVLKFKLSSRQRYFHNCVVNLAIYGEKGGKILKTFKTKDFQSSQNIQLNLKEFANQTVKIVFANSIQNHPNFKVQVINPTLYVSASEEHSLRTPGKIVKKNQGSQKEVKAPNIFIYLIDTLRADHMSCYGYSRKTTPNIDAFSKECILFKKCFATATWTKPTVGSILTGMYPNKHRGEDKKDQLSSDVDMIAEILKQYGYTTIYITPNVNTSKEVNFNQGIDHYIFSEGGANLNNFYHSSEFVNKEFSEIIEKQTGTNKTPIFAYLHTVDPHDPYSPKAPFLKFKKTDKKREVFSSSDEIRMKKALSGLTNEDIDYIKSLYDCEILHNDFYFGKFIQFLKNKNLYHNSIIILVADHGEQFNEHQGLFHGSSIYNEEIHVPLIIKFPKGEFSGSLFEKFVSQVDIVPTILDYIGINISTNIDGESVLNLMQGDQINRSLYVKEKLNRDKKHKNNFLGIINAKEKIKHIITYQDQFFINALNTESYNLRSDFKEKQDVLEKNNLYQLKSIQFLADFFLEKIKSMAMKKEKKLNLKKLDPQKLKQLKALGYIN